MSNPVFTVGDAVIWDTEAEPKSLVAWLRKTHGDGPFKVTDTIPVLGNPSAPDVVFGHSQLVHLAGPQGQLMISALGLEMKKGFSGEFIKRAN